LFWTDVVSTDRVQVDLGAGQAAIEVRNLHMKDYFTFENAVVGGGPDPVPGTVSFRVEWTATGAVREFDNPAQQFLGLFRDASAQMVWTARSVDFDFVSAPIGTSESAAAELGAERNGSFY
jgi:hypothetical protein